MARDPKGAWLSTLLNIFGDTTGLEAKPVPTAGSTTAKLMPNAINFGPAMPGKKYTAHNANEYKEVRRSRPGHADVHRDAGAHRQSGPDAVGAARGCRPRTILIVRIAPAANPVYADGAVDNDYFFVPFAGASGFGSIALSGSLFHIWLRPTIAMPRYPRTSSCFPSGLTFMSAR